MGLCNRDKLDFARINCYMTHALQWAKIAAANILLKGDNDPNPLFFCDVRNPYLPMAVPFTKIRAIHSVVWVDSGVSLRINDPNIRGVRYFKQ
jgi:hypothetical protein